MFDKLLIANRGEIALRIMRTARRLGYRTVAVYSEADAGAAHVAAADESVLIGPAPASASYLRSDAILAAARQTGAGAIHPGYGFLSENAAFAAACADAGVGFVGPPPAAIELMGNKSASKAAMLAAGVPCVPGYHGDDQSDARFVEEAARIGFPVMVKAAAGGGGRGMRLVAGAQALPTALASARAEAESAFGSAELLLEKAVTGARHVEIQVFADDHGNVVHLGERDCSIQRRHQKVIEESPSPAVDAALRERMGAAATLAARACDYRGAGTVEFLLAADGDFYFLEMNTRLQVEHPVTEAVTGFDLVEWQLVVASGGALPARQADIALRGHAIEARLYAEDPAHGYLPQTGRIAVCRWPSGSAVRVDAAVVEGSVVGPYYDPMIAKLVAHGPTRDAARRALAAALTDTTLFGVVTNKAFLARICRHPEFAAGRATTTFLTSHFDDDPSVTAAAPSDLDRAIAALVVYLEAARAVVEDDSFIGWRSAGPGWAALELAAGDARATVQVSATGVGALGRCYRVARETDDGVAEPIDLEVVRCAAGELELIEGGVRRTVRFADDGEQLWLDDGETVQRWLDVTHQPAEVQGGEASGRVTAPLDGAVIGVEVSAGQTVAKGQALVVLEAMKMEHRLVAAFDGTVACLHVAVGQQVKTRQLLAEITPTSPTVEATP